MLRSLHVKNLALIEEAEVEFEEGLNILSGETGAGKSIIIGSINLALGEKVQKEMLRENADLLQVLVRYHADRDLERIVQDIAKHYNERRLGASRKIMDPDTIHLVSTYLYSGCYHLIREWLVRDIQKTPREIAELLVSIVSKEYL